MNADQAEWNDTIAKLATMQGEDIEHFVAQLNESVGHQLHLRRDLDFRTRALAEAIVRVLGFTAIGFWKVDERATTELRKALDNAGIVIKLV